jgi:hypothetical protein
MMPPASPGQLRHPARHDGQRHHHQVWARYVHHPLEVGQEGDALQRLAQALQQQRRNNNTEYESSM